MAQIQTEIIPWGESLRRRENKLAQLEVQKTPSRRLASAWSQNFTQQMHDLDQRLAAATAGISQKFILLPIHGQPATFRERVYCYELYHQLRKDWPQDSPFELNGEVDKAGHQHLRLWHGDKCKPDFLIHTPGDMAGNFAILEVKPCQASAKAIRKDLATLALFSGDSIRYRRALYLIYGTRAHQMAQRVQQLRADVTGAGKVEIWIHTEARQPAERWDG